VKVLLCSFLSLFSGLFVSPVLSAAPGQTAPAAEKPAEAPPTQPKSQPASEAMTPSERADLLWHYRNLGKALYENPATQYDAVDVLKKALELAPDSARERVNLGLALLRAGKTDEGIADLEKAQKQDPSIPHTWFNLGIAFKRESEYDKAIHQLEGMAERVPDEPITHYNLGVLYRLQGQPERALEELEKAAALDPRLAGPHFQLATAYRKAGRTEDAQREMARFRELKAAGSGDEDLEWSWYSELYETVEPAARPAPTAQPAFQVRELTPAPTGAPTGLGNRQPAASEGRSGDGTAHPAGVGIGLLTADGDDLPDLVSWTARGVEVWTDPEAPATRVGNLRAVRSVAAGDFDNDGLDDLAVVDADGVTLWANRGAGGDGTLRFERLAQTGGGDAATSGPDAGKPHAGGPETETPAAGPAPEQAAAPLPWRRTADRVVWLDFDHDYDLDLLVLGAQPALFRNDGDGTFSDQTERFPFAPLPAGARVTAAVRIDVAADSQAADLVVARSDGSAILYRDLLGGAFEARPLPSLAALPGGVRRLLAADVDHDGWTDLVAAGDEGVTLLRNDHQEGFAAEPIAAQGDGPVALLDLDDRGANDLAFAVSAGHRSGAGDGGAADSATGIGPIHLSWDRGRGTFEPADGAVAASAGTPSALAAADFDGDGRTDLAAVDRSGTVRLLVNRTATDQHWLRIGLTGVKNPRLAHGAEIEVKAGTLYQKKLYDGVPVVFGLGGRDQADTVRITWPNGLIQNEIRQPTGAFERYQEAPRLSGSCPMIFTWNGSAFQFITDVLGVAPLGASAGDGTYFPVDHDEGIRIPGSALARRLDGRYEVRIAEELREVAYLDEIRLAAIDHPADVEVLTNDKFKGPPFPELRLYGATDPLHPVAALDDQGRDVHERLAAKDAVYPDGFARRPDGMAELHTLTLDFGPDAYQGRALLVLSGWVDWADGSTFLAASQGGGPDPVGLVLPSLQVQDPSGRWVTVLDDMGLPAGKPKTIAVDLTGLLPAGWRRLRIVTSLCIYWDEIYLSPDPGPPSLRRTEIPLESAKLHFRGFSKVVIDPERKQPEHFVYSETRASTGAIEVWNPTPGLYTRYGQVGELLRSLDDRFVIMGSGDEVRMVFDPAALPPVPAGWTRDFLLFVDGWAKDADANTAYSQTVEPLPYHGMPQYPYAAPNAYPSDPIHTLYREHYLTRPALRFFRPLTEGIEGIAPAAAGGGSP